MSNPGLLNLMDELCIDFRVLIDQGTQEPGHLQDLDRDLMIGVNQSGISWSWRLGLLEFSHTRGSVYVAKTGPIVGVPNQDRQ